MKQGLLLLLAGLVSLAAGAQDTKDQEKILNQKWQSFTVNEAKQAPVRPEPKSIPVAPKGATPKTMELPVSSAGADLEAAFREDALGHLRDLFDTPEAPLSTPAYMEIGEGAEDERFQFFNIPVKMLAPSATQDSRLHKNIGLSEKDISGFWAALEKPGKKTASFKDQVIPLFVSCRDTYDLSDWTLYRLIEAYAASEWSHPTHRIVARVFLLNNLGIEAKMARVGDHIAILMPAKQTVFGHSYITLSGMPYYLMEEGFPPQILTYPQRGSYKTEPIDLALAHNDLVFDTQPPIQVEKDLTRVKLKINVPISRARCEFYESYPAVSVKHYAHSHADPTFCSALLKQLAPLRKKGTVAGVQALLDCIQLDFDYATDHEQFGKEKPFFLEENFLYPYNDCEDRAILFVFLVKRLFKLDAVLLEYPNHVAAAVCFNTSVPGAYIQHNGRNYVICDPTYLGADIGMVIPHLKDTPAEVITMP